MHADDAWRLLWTANALLQVCGIVITLWRCWQAQGGIARSFWGVFTLNWCFTLLRHVAVHDVFPRPLDMLAAVSQGMKLGAMVTEFLLMEIVVRWMRQATANARDARGDAE